MATENHHFHEGNIHISNVEELIGHISSVLGEGLSPEGVQLVRGSFGTFSVRTYLDILSADSEHGAFGFSKNLKIFLIEQRAAAAERDAAEAVQAKTAAEQVAAEAVKAKVVAECERDALYLLYLESNTNATSLRSLGVILFDFVRPNPRNPPPLFESFFMSPLQRFPPRRLLPNLGELGLLFINGANLPDLTSENGLVPRFMSLFEHVFPRDSQLRVINSTSTAVDRNATLQRPDCFFYFHAANAVASWELGAIVVEFKLCAFHVADSGTRARSIVTGRKRWAGCSRAETTCSTPFCSALSLTGLTFSLSSYR